MCAAAIIIALKNTKKGQRKSKRSYSTPRSAFHPGEICMLAQLGGVLWLPPGRFQVFHALVD